MPVPETSADDAREPDVRAALLEVTALLEKIAASKDVLAPLTDDERHRLFNAAGDVWCRDPEERRLRTKARRRARRAEKAKAETETLNQTGIRVLRDKPVFMTPNVFAPDGFDQDTVDEPEYRESVEPQHCYVCKEHYTQVHHFYDQMCPTCAAFNFAKRSELADLSGMVGLLTGGRVKIGYQAGIKLLRCGADLIVATRFPRDAAARYAAEEDFDEWGDRLEIFGLDLRHTPSVEAFCSHILATRTRLDFIVNNACQTVRRPSAFYAHMMHGESKALAELDPAILGLVGEYEGLRGQDLVSGSAAERTLQLNRSAASDPAGADASGTAVGGVVPSVDEVAVALPDAAALSQHVLLPEDDGADGALFPEGRLDQDMQQVDLRGRNSWRMLLHEVSSVELLETQLVNAVAPFVLNARLKPLMEQTPGHHKHIVNVSAVEGQFYRRYKTTRHPHTNMAKAALNMMTRTSAADYESAGIHMNSVDTGWVSDEDPADIAQQKQDEHGFHPPLDIVDGAARIVDPIIEGVNTGTHVWGKFLKDYRETDW